MTDPTLFDLSSDEFRIAVREVPHSRVIRSSNSILVVQVYKGIVHYVLLSCSYDGSRHHVIIFRSPLIEVLVIPAESIEEELAREDVRETGAPTSEDRSFEFSHL